MSILAAIRREPQMREERLPREQRFYSFPLLVA